MENKDSKINKNVGSGGAVYGLGLIGAVVYYFQQSNNAPEIIIGIFKAIIWPALLVYKALELLKL